MDHDSQIASLQAQLDAEREKNNILEEQVRVLTTGLLPDEDALWVMEVKERFKLTYTESDLLKILYKQRMVSKEYLLDALYAKRPFVDQPDHKIIDVFICKLRKKLPANTVETVWGRGYMLTPEGRERLKGLLEPRQVAA